MIAFALASLSFGTSLLQRLQQFAPELSPRVRKCCLLGVHFIQVTTICCGGSLSSVQPEVRFRANLSYVHTQLLSFAISLRHTESGLHTYLNLRERLFHKNGVAGEVDCWGQKCAGRGTSPVSPLLSHMKLFF